MTCVMRAWKHDSMTVDVHVDSTWAKGPQTKSTSGGMLMINGTVVKHWSRTQVSRALSTAEAEYCAVIPGATEVSEQSIMTDVGLSAQVRIRTDSNAATAIASRRGLGNTRHTDSTYLWLQEVTKSKRKRVPGEQHLADHSTEAKSWCKMDELMQGGFRQVSLGES